MLPSKSWKTINANFLLKNFGLTFCDRFKTGAYLVNWFGRGSADTEPEGRYRCRCRFIGRSLVDNMEKVGNMAHILTNMVVCLGT